MFTKVIDTPAKTKLSTFFLSACPRAFHPEEIRKSVGEPGASVASNLRQLARDKFLSPVERSGEVYYRLNPRYPYTEELKGLLLKKPFPVKDRVVRELSRIKSASLIILTGIFVGQKTLPADIIFVGDLNTATVKKVVDHIEREIRQEVNYVLFTVEQYNERVHMYDRFMRDVLDNQHIIILDKLNKKSKNKNPASHASV